MNFDGKGGVDSDMLHSHWKCMCMSVFSFSLLTKCKKKNGQERRLFIIAFNQCRLYMIIFVPISQVSSFRDSRPWKIIRGNRSGWNSYRKINFFLQFLRHFFLKFGPKEGMPFKLFFPRKFLINRFFCHGN